LARDPAGWGSVKHPELGPFRLGKTNPTISTSGLHALVSTYVAAAGVERPLVEADLTNPTTVAYVHDVESAVLHYGDAVSTFLTHLLSPAVQSRFTDAAFRDYAGKPGPQISAANGLNPLEPRTLARLPDGPVLVRMQRSWNDLRKRAHLLIAIDVSRPMGEAL